MVQKITPATALKKVPDPVQEKKAIDVSDDWYLVPKGRNNPPKLVPSAVKLQKLANGSEQKISTFVKRIDRDDRGLTVWVKGIIGNPENPEQVKEAVVDMDFQTESIELILSKIAYGKVSYRLQELPSGQILPVLSNSKDQLTLLREMNRIRRFGLRTLISKAEAIVHKKLLGHNWQEPEEAAAEAHEVALVNQDMGNKNVTIDSVFYVMGIAGHSRAAVEARIQQRYKKKSSELIQEEILELWKYCENGDHGHE
ncbi:hypothetical protein ACFL35_17360 [Candidatus Riflebacteria bacterium]